MSQLLCREPLEFAAGDTLSFERAFSSYPASQGWVLDYEMRGTGNASGQPISFQSVADGDDHAVIVPAATTAGWLAGSYTLAGYAVNNSSSQRHQIYEGQLSVKTNLQTAGGSDVQPTFAQQMVQMLESILIGKNDLTESRIGETIFRYESIIAVRQEHGYWKSVRRNEIAIERAKAGLPAGNITRPVINITSLGTNLATGVSIPLGLPSSK